MEGRDRHQEQMAQSLSETGSGETGGGVEIPTENFPKLRGMFLE